MICSQTRCTPIPACCWTRSPIWTRPSGIAARWAARCHRRLRHRQGAAFTRAVRWPSTAASASDLNAAPMYLTGAWPVSPQKPTITEPLKMYDETFLRRAIALSAEALETPGLEPFGAVIVKDGQIVGEGINRSVMNHDPTSHGETEAIRDACRKLETVDLRGCDLYSSCEPCALCVAAMQIVGVSRLYYAAGLVESNAVLKDVPPRNRFV